MSVRPLQRAQQKRPLWPFLALLLVGCGLYAALFGMDGVESKQGTDSASWNIESLTDVDQRAKAFDRVSMFMDGLSDPATDAEFIDKAVGLTLETISIAVIGVALAAVLAFLLALGASKAVMVGLDRKRGFDPTRPLRHGICALCRLILDVLRAVPDFAWAVILVPMLGLGPVTGAMALAVSVTGILGKVYSELWDSVDPKRYETVRALGAGRLGTFFYGIRPLASRQTMSFTLMRAECGVRNAAVIGVVGGGGLGSELMLRLDYGEYGKVATLLWFTLALTVAVDLASNFVRRQLRNDPNHPHAARHLSPKAQVLRSYMGAGFVLASVGWALWYQHTHGALKPLINLLEGKSWKRLEFFKGLLKPSFDWDAVVWPALQSCAVPLAIAVVGTLAGVALAILLTYPHSVAYQFESHHFTGERPRPWVKAWRWSLGVLARLAGVTARGVPEVMWALLFISFFGLGLMPAAVAIALHTAGVLVRVFTETVDNIPYRKLEQTFTGSRLRSFAYTAMPVSRRDWMTYSFFQFESNVRAAVVLGIVGVGGLGFKFKFAFDWFKYEKASTYLIVMILLTVVIDRISRSLKLSRVS